jgi:hypothetical protein
MNTPRFTTFIKRAFRNNPIKILFQSFMQPYEFERYWYFDFFLVCTNNIYTRVKHIKMLKNFPSFFRCSGYWGIPVHLLLGPFISPTSAQGRNDDRSSTEKTLMRRRLMRRMTVKQPRARRPPHDLFLMRERTTSMSAWHISILSKKIRAKDYVPSTLPLIGRRPAFTVPA